MMLCISCKTVAKILNQCDWRVDVLWLRWDAKVSVVLGRVHVLLIVSSLNLSARKPGIVIFVWPAGGFWTYPCRQGCYSLLNSAPARHPCTQNPNWTNVGPKCFRVHQCLPRDCLSFEMRSLSLAEAKNSKHILQNANHRALLRRETSTFSSIFNVSAQTALGDIFLFSLEGHSPLKGRMVLISLFLCVWATRVRVWMLRVCSITMWSTFDKTLKGGRGLQSLSCFEFNFRNWKCALLRSRHDQKRNWKRNASLQGAQRAAQKVFDESVCQANTGGNTTAHEEPVSSEILICSAVFKPDSLCREKHFRWKIVEQKVFSFRDIYVLETRQQPLGAWGNGWRKVENLIWT